MDSFCFIMSNWTVKLVQKCKVCGHFKREQKEFRNALNLVGEFRDIEAKRTVL